MTAEAELLALSHGSNKVQAARRSDDFTALQQEDCNFVPHAPPGQRPTGILLACIKRLGHLSCGKNKLPG